MSDGKTNVDVLYVYTSFKTTRGTATPSLDAVAPKIAKFINIKKSKFEVRLIIYALDSLFPAAMRGFTAVEKFFLFI